MARINPFSPNGPVNPGTFVGRLAELERLETSLFQTASENPLNFMITGERGIGKTSLLNYLKHVAEGNIEVEKRRFSFLIIDTDIDQSTTQRTLLRKIELGMEKSLAKVESARALLKEAWAFLQRVEAAGVRVSAVEKQEDDELLVDEFSYSFAELVARLCHQGASGSLSAKYDGVIVLIDEADNAGDQLRLGSFLKLLAERLQRRGCGRVMFGLAGLPELRGVLAKSHPSSLRMFEEVPLDRLSEAEVRRVVTICLKVSARLNKQSTRVADQAMETLIFFPKVTHTSFNSLDTQHSRLIEIVI